MIYDTIDTLENHRIFSYRISIVSLVRVLFRTRINNMQIPLWHWEWRNNIVNIARPARLIEIFSLLSTKKLKNKEKSANKKKRYESFLWDEGGGVLCAANGSVCLIDSPLVSVARVTRFARPFRMRISDAHTLNRLNVQKN